MESNGRNDLDLLSVPFLRRCSTFLISFYSFIAHIIFIMSVDHLINLLNYLDDRYLDDRYLKKNAAKERPVSKQEAKLASAQPVTTKSPVGPGL